MLNKMTVLESLYSTSQWATGNQLSNGTKCLILLQLQRKSKVFTPKFLVKAVCNSQVCPPTLVTSLKILLDTLQECKRNLPPELFISHNKVGYTQLHQPQYKILSETIILHSFLPATSMHTSNNKLRWPLTSSAAGGEYSHKQIYKTCVLSFCCHFQKQWEDLVTMLTSTLETESCEDK